MHLQGWQNPLPAFIVKAIEAGAIVIKQEKDYQYLVGEVMHPSSSHKIVFQ